jgi:hypothetical protein
MHQRRRLVGLPLGSQQGERDEKERRKLGLTCEVDEDRSVNVVWTDSWLSIASACCDLICVGAGEERA